MNMNRRKSTGILVYALMLFVLSACENIFDTDNPDNEQVINSEDFKGSVIDALAENCANHEEASDYEWNNQDVVSLILNGINIGCSASSPVFIKSADKTVIILAYNTENFITDGIGNSSSDDEPNAAIFSVSNLTIGGNGSLNVDGNNNDGIASKDGLLIKSGTIKVNAADDGIRGKDYLIIKDGNITVDAAGDGLKADNDEDADKGYILIEKGILNITSGGDGFEAVTDMLISDGEITITSGGGSGASIGVDASAKGFKGLVNTIIEKGTFILNTADDAIHSNGSVSLNEGTYTISTGDDAVHADSVAGINGGEITVTRSYEGIESAMITISNGNIHIISSDDGINIASGVDGSGMIGGPGVPIRPGQPPSYTSSGNYWLYINGGNIVLETAGDGIDINGSVVMTDGNLIINGPTANNNGALDYDASFTINGGFLLGVGSSGMAQVPGTTSTQNSILLNFKTSIQPGTLVSILTSTGEELFCFKPAKRYQSLVFSSSELVKGVQYDIYTGGSSTGTIIDGLYKDGTYSPGTKYTSFSVSGVSTKIN